MDRTEVDNQTTEVINAHSSTDCVYVKVYDKGLKYMIGMSKTQRNLTYLLIFSMSDASEKCGMCVTLNSERKKDMCEKLQLTKIQSLNNTLSQLVKTKVVKRLGDNKYQINPFLFGKGEWEDIVEIRVEWIEYLIGTPYEEVFLTEDNE